MERGADMEGEICGRVKETAGVAVVVLGGMTLGAAVFLASFFAPVLVFWDMGGGWGFGHGHGSSSGSGSGYGYGNPFTSYNTSCFLTTVCTFLPIALTTITIALALLYLLHFPSSS